MLSDEQFAEVRYQWLGDLERTNCFANFDHKPAKAHPLNMTLDSALAEDILRKVYEIGGCPPNEIFGSIKSDSVNRWRQIAFLYARKVKCLSYGVIGTMFERDHSTIRHSVERAIDRLNRDRDFQHDYQRLSQALS